MVSREVIEASGLGVVKGSVGVRLMAGVDGRVCRKWNDECQRHGNLKVSKTSVMTF